MQECEFKKGVFIQRQCALPAYHQCADCNITVCRTHSRAIENSENEVLCYNCFISANQLDEEQTRRRYLESDEDFWLWYASVRRDYAVDKYLFDEQDYRDFDLTNREQQVYLEDDDDFFDS